MNISGPDDVHRLLEEIAELSQTARRIRITAMIEHVEMNFMYYDDRGSVRGMDRMRVCLDLLQKALPEETTSG